VNANESRPAGNGAAMKQVLGGASPSVYPLPLSPHQRHREAAIRRRASSELDAIIARLYGGDRRAA